MQEDSKSQPHKRSWVNLLIVSLFLLVLIAILPFFELRTQNIEAISLEPSIFIKKESSLSALPVFQENTLFPLSAHFLVSKERPPIKMEVIVTAYSSTFWQTDDTPYITAAGTWVRNGIVAANFLPFGTKIRIPEIYGDEVFVVEDRMHPRNHYHVDVWLPSYWEALNFGAKRTYIEILEE